MINPNDFLRPILGRVFFDKKYLYVFSELRRFLFFRHEKHIEKNINFFFKKRKRVW